ncbi:MAG: hypothetical protein GQ547_02730 [Methylophaga sp.]|nr:hypothetical protein [Methylophaga sp.]
MAKFRNACRQSIQSDLRKVKLSYFREHSIKGRVKCQESNELLKWEELNIDHRQPNTFSVIVERFVEKNSITLESIEYNEIDGGQDELADIKLKELFILFHKEKANLRLINQGLNLGRSHQSRINRQKKDLVIE